MTLPNVGIDISETSMKYIRFTRKHAHDKDLTLSAWGDEAIAPGIIERGDIKDVNQLAQVLLRVKAAAGASYARLSLPEERAYLFETTIKRGTPFNEIRGLLEFKLEENVPLSPRDAFFDYEIVESDEHDDHEDVMHIVVAVYARKTILDYYEACRQARLVPLSFEIEAQAIARACVPFECGDVSMVVDFGKTRTGIGIVYHDSLMYTSTIDIGGAALSTALKKVMGEISEDELMMIKNKEGLVATKEHKAAGEALLSVIASVKDEIETRIQYWHTRSIERQRRDIKRIILCGGSANLRGLPEYLTRELGIQAKRADVWQNAFSIDTFLPPIKKRYSYGYTTAVGLALHDFIDNDP
jgi:type IV pilus assembly protein PilM